MTDSYVLNKIYYKVSVKHYLNNGDKYIYLEEEYDSVEEAETTIKYYIKYGYDVKLEKFTIELIRYC
jgi:uncharacterized protein YaaR (DUF327 family)